METDDERDGRHQLEAEERATRAVHDLAQAAPVSAVLETLALYVSVRAVILLNGKRDFELLDVRAQQMADEWSSKDAKDIEMRLIGPRASRGGSA